MLARAYTIVELTPTRLELAVVTGGAVQQRRAERYNPPAPGADWAEMLRARHQTLAAWVRELNVTGSPATVLFSSPTAVAALPSCPALLGEAAIERASVLALAESAGYPIGDNPTSTATLLIDRRPVEKPAQSGTQPGAGQRMAHSLAVVETDANCTLLAQWIASCGLTPARLLPAAAAPIARLAGMLAPRGRASTQALQATLWFGEHESFFIVGDQDGMVLFRALSVGVENLVEALLRPITPRNADGTNAEPVSIDRAAARSLLERCGIPQPADLVDDRTGFTGASVLPLMNPVLQRFSIEIKQSLRFGLSDKQRAAVALTLYGPGAALPRIETALGQLCGITVVPSPTRGEAADRGSSTQGNIAAIIADPAPAVSLLPASMQQAQIKLRARRSLWTGVAISAATVALYGGWLFTDLSATRAQADALRARAEEAKRAEQAAQIASAGAAAANAANAYVSRAMGYAPDISAVLALLGETTDKRTTLESIDLRESETAWVCRVTGVMHAGDDKAFADALRAYTDAIARSPLVAGVKLGAAARTKVNDTDAHRFDLAVELVEVPYTVVAPEALVTAEPASGGNQGGAK